MSLEAGLLGDGGEGEHWLPAAAWEADPCVGAGEAMDGGLLPQGELGSTGGPRLP